MRQSVTRLNLSIINRLAPTLLLGGFFLFALFGPILMPGSLGQGDFRAYWSAAYLLGQSQNFADTALLGEVQRSLTGWTGEFVMSTWNPPWLLVLMLPYTAVSFARATWLWLISNIFFVFGSTVLLWQTPLPQQGNKNKYLVLLMPFASLLFLPTLVALWMGQVNTLVFAGLAAFLFFHFRQRPFLAGASLILTLVKPHLVYVTIPALLLLALRQRNWQLLGGLFFSMISLTAIMFALRPGFLFDYLYGVGDGRLLLWQTPTLGGALAHWFGWQWAKLMGIVILPVALFYVWRRGHHINISLLVYFTLLISLITAPFGWGYDAIILLIPLLQMVVWVVEGQLFWADSFIVVAFLFLLNGLAMYQRFHLSNEVELFWLPLVAALFFVYAYWRRAKSVASGTAVI